MVQRLPFYLVFCLLFTGCASFEPGEILSQPQKWFEQTDEQPEVAVAKPAADLQYEDELRALFEQPYIDPLTDYLATHSEDRNRADPLRKVSAERQIRCQKIADIYAERALSHENLQRYQAAYTYSCPTEVAAFAKRVAKAETETASAETTPVESPAPFEAVILNEEIESAVDKAQLNDCYLLTTISNFREAKEKCLSPANEGDVRSQVNMALIHYALVEYSQALQWALKVEQDAPRAQLLLGEMYAAGHGVKQNDETAFNWFKNAAEGNDAEGQFMTAQRYQQGAGVSQDIQQANVWYQRAAENNNLRAKHALGALLLQQNAVAATDHSSEDWLIKAASQGHAASSDLLGEWNAKQPNTADKASAVVWFELAQQQGDASAALRANALRQVVSQSAIDTARLEIQQRLQQHR